MFRGKIEGQLFYIISLSRQSAIDITAQFVYERLNHNVTTNLVIISLMTLPDEMPPAFASSYTPIAAAGTDVTVSFTINC